MEVLGFNPYLKVFYLRGRLTVVDHEGGRL